MPIERRNQDRLAAASEWTDEQLAEAGREWARRQDERHRAYMEEQVHRPRREAWAVFAAEMTAKYGLAEDVMYDIWEAYDGFYETWDR